MRSDDPMAARGGFTLVELMVGLVLGVLVVGFVLDFVTGQTKIATRQTAREEVQQNARGALEVIASDLRGSISSGLIQASDAEIRFMVPRRWGIVCGGNGSTQTTAVFPVLPGDAVPFGDGVGLIVLTGGNWRPAIVGANPTLATVTSRAAASLTAVPGCGSRSASGQVEAFTFTGANHPAVNAGDRIAIYQVVRYDVGTSQGRNWIRRSNGSGLADTNMQPLAGPVDSLRFDYFSGSPPAALPAPGTAAATAGIQMIRVALKTSSRASIPGQAVTETGSVTVQIRN